jgi:hypothetical protein
MVLASCTKQLFRCCQFLGGSKSLLQNAVTMPFLSDISIFSLTGGFSLSLGLRFSFSLSLRFSFSLSLRFTLGSGP